MLEVILTKPGGQQQGPFTIERINRDLAAGKYKDIDYWAWYEGLPEWVPLYTVPGVAAGSHATLEPETALEPLPELVTAAAGDTTAKSSAAEPVPRAAPPSPQESPNAVKPQLASGMPFTALEQLMILTTGEGPSASRSPVTGRMLEETTGADLARVRQGVPRHVVSRCEAVNRLRRESSIPDTAWRALASVQPELVTQARAGRFKICVRTYPLETGDFVALFLFYNKEKL